MNAHDRRRLSAVHVLVTPATQILYSSCGAAPRLLATEGLIVKRFSPFFLSAIVRSVRRRRLGPRQVGLPSDLLLSMGLTWIYIVRALVAVVIARVLSSKPTFELFAPTAKSLIVHQVPRCPALLRATGIISARASQFCLPRSEHFLYERQSTPCVQSHTLFGPPLVASS